MRKTTPKNAYKRLQIERALHSVPISQDEPFVELMEHLARRDRNLNAVLQHINSYSTSVRRERQSKYALQEAHKQYASVRAKKWGNLIFATFTPRYELNSDALKSRYVAFINTLSKGTYKNAYKRHGKRIEHHSFIEGDKNTRTHIHALIQVPDGRNINRFRTAVKECWWNAGVVHFAETDDYTDDDIDAIAGYITKTRTKGGRGGTQLLDSFIP